MADIRPTSHLPRLHPNQLPQGGRGGHRVARKRQGKFAARPEECWRNDSHCVRCCTHRPTWSCFIHLLFPLDRQGRPEAQECSGFYMTAHRWSYQQLLPPRYTLRGPRGAKGPRRGTDECSSRENMNRIRGETRTRKGPSG